MVLMEQAMLDFARRALGGLIEDWRREADVRELSALSDHLLADIGLRRDQLASLRLPATQPARAPEPVVARAHRPELQICG